MLTLSGMRKAYGERVLFADAGLQVNREDRIGLVGPNGAGKTTLFSIILGEEPSDEGKFSVERGVRIGYLQDNRFRGLSIGTVHVPNASSGTGFGIQENLSEADLTAETLHKALVHAPDWARDRSSVRKWKNFAAFKASNGFNGEYKLVAPALISSEVRPMNEQIFGKDLRVGDTIEV